MPAAAHSLRDLHQLHQRARAMRDRLTSGPKTLAARHAALAARQSELEGGRKRLQDARIQLKKHEHSLQSVESKIDDLKTKLNQVKKNDEYKALQNQIAHENATKAKLEDDVILALDAIESQTVELARLENDVKRFGAEVAALQQQIDDQTVAHQAQLRELETAITEAESAIPEEYRDRYRRIVLRYGADALAACEDGACRGCFTAATAQMINDLINNQSLCFCLSCGRLLYLTEHDLASTLRGTKS
jgi:predicted  nucleic acid-binding Zn-ribbon protein